MKKQTLSKLHQPSPITSTDISDIKVSLRRVLWLHRIGVIGTDKFGVATVSGNSKLEEFYLDSGQWTHALSANDRILLQNPADWGAYQMRFRILMKLHKFEEGITTARTAELLVQKQLNRKTSSTSYQWGWKHVFLSNVLMAHACRRSGHPSEAKEQLKKAAEALDETNKNGLTVSPEWRTLALWETCFLANVGRFDGDDTGNLQLLTDKFAEGASHKGSVVKKIVQDIAIQDKVVIDKYLLRILRYSGFDEEVAGDVNI